MSRVFATFLKKGSAKNFPTGKILGYFSKELRSTEMCSRLSVLLFILSGCAAWSLMVLCSSLKVFGFAFFKKRMGFGATPHKNGVFFLQSFFFCAFCAKRKSDVGELVCVEILCRFFEKKLRKKLSNRKDFGLFFKNSTLDGCCQSSSVFLLNYAVGVCGLKFDGIMLEFGCRHCRPSLRQQIYNVSVGERSDSIKGSLREGAGAGRD